MKYLKLVLAGILVVVSASQFFIYGFLGFMIVWLLYSLFYLGASVYQRFHKSSVLSQIITLVYIAVPLSGILIYEIHSGLSQLTQTFYIVFMIVLALALVWEIASLCLVIRENSNGKS